MSYLTWKLIWKLIGLRTKLTLIERKLQIRLNKKKIHNNKLEGGWVEAAMQRKTRRVGGYWLPCSQVILLFRLLFYFFVDGVVLRASNGIILKLIILKLIILKLKLIILKLLIILIKKRLRITKKLKHNRTKLQIRLNKKKIHIKKLEGGWVEAAVQRKTRRVGGYWLPCSQVILLFRFSFLFLC